MKSDWKEMLSSVYGLAVDSKNFLYHCGLADSIRLPVEVLSVGNLSLGGTGKTPVVQKILSMAHARKIKTAVVARNYKALSRGIRLVEPKASNGAAFYGDEPFLTAFQFPETAVFTGPAKYQTAQEAFKKSQFQLLVVDDGFQHRKLHRDFDLVLLDATAPESEDHLIPAGRLRENFSSLNRATAVVLTKTNWADPERIEQLKKRIPKGMDVYELEFQTQVSNEIPLQSRILAVSGIAKPQVFHKNLEKSFLVADHLIFKDHHQYQMADADLILQKMKQLGCQQILTTEKDFVKLQVFEDLREFLNPVRVMTHFKEEPKGLYAFLDQCLRH